jgi:hypothetical protein
VRVSYADQLVHLFRPDRQFLILVLLLRHFLYGPITKAMDEREAKLKALFVEAEEEKQRAAKRSNSIGSNAANWIQTEPEFWPSRNRGRRTPP